MVLRVVTYHPGRNEDLGIPAAKLEIKDKGPLNIKFDDQEADAEGFITLQFDYDDSVGSTLHPQFKIEVPEAARSMLAAETGNAEPLSLPEKWTTGHGKRGASVALDAHPDNSKALPLYVGLPIVFTLSYTDFHPSGIRNPTALPGPNPGREGLRRGYYRLHALAQRRGLHARQGRGCRFQIAGLGRRRPPPPQRRPAHGTPPPSRNAPS